MGRDVRAAVEQAEALIAALLTLARNERGLAVRERVDLATVAEDVLDAADIGDRRTHVSLLSASTTGDPILLERLTGNLLHNAVRHNTPGGEVWLATSTVDGLAVLTVANTGPVIAPEAVDGLFEPFRRLRERTGGDGFAPGPTDRRLHRCRPRRIGHRTAETRRRPAGRGRTSGSPSTPDRLSKGTARTAGHRHRRRFAGDSGSSPGVSCGHKIVIHFGSWRRLANIRWASGNCVTTPARCLPGFGMGRRSMLRSTVAWWLGSCRWRSGNRRRCWTG
jgi:hypothetical protein